MRELGAINIFSKVLVITVNYILPIGLIFYNVFKNDVKNKTLIAIAIIYLIVFLFATPVYQIGAKLIILPLIILSFNLNNRKI